MDRHGYNAKHMDALANRHLNTIDASGESFDDYVATTIDPGNSLFLIALSICIVSIVALPLLGRCLKRRKENQNKYKSDSRVDDQIGDLEIALRTIPKEINERLNETQTTAISGEQPGIDNDEHSTTSSLTACFVGDKTLGVDFLCMSLNFVLSIAKFDKEAKRIFSLVIPFTFSAIVRTASELFVLAIISHSLGTDDMVAYAMVGSIIGVSSSFMGGWIEAISSLGSMAYGARNYNLTGHYLQISFVAYILCEIPMAFVWIYFMGKILLLMGFEESVAIIGQNYVWVAVLITIMSKLNMGVMEFLGLTERATYASVVYCISCFLGAILVAPFAIMMDASLEELGLVLLFNQALLFALNVVIPAKMGWLKEFEDGLFKGLSVKSFSVVNEVFQVALPLAFGNLLAYAEWEVLTILAVVLGPAEAATWSVLGYIWDLFESTTEAIGDASELRVAYHLGNNNPGMAKFSGYKSMLLAAIATGSASIIFMSLTNVLPPLLTYDETIQGMLVELFPLVALGNVTMSMGMVCWAIVGAQGRYRLSTTIATSCAFFITIPIAAVSTVMRVDLRGMTFAVVVGYTVTAMLLSLCVVMSDWKALAEEISEEMDDSSSCSSDLMKLCSETPSISTPAKPAPYTPPINPSSRPGDFASYSETPDYRLLPSLPTLTPVCSNNVHSEVIYKEMDDSYLYQTGLMKVRPEPPSITTPATAAPYKPPFNPPSRTGDFASRVEMPTYQLLPKHTSVNTNDFLGEVLNPVPMPPVLAASEARVKLSSLCQTNYIDTVETVETVEHSPLRMVTNPELIEAAPSAACDKSPDVVLTMSPVLSTESSSEKAALPQKLEEDDQSSLPDTLQLTAVSDPITGYAPAMLVNKSPSHPAAKSTSNESELDLPEDILEPPSLIAACPLDELLAIKLTILTIPSKPTGSAVLPPAPEANEPPTPTASDLVLADKLLDTTTIPMLLELENTATDPDLAPEPAPYDIVAGPSVTILQPPPLIARNPSDESLAVALITLSMSSTEPIENSVLPPTPEADVPNLPAVDDPTLTDKSPDTPDIPGVVDNIITLRESASEPTPDDIVNDSEYDVCPASIDSDYGRIGDVITSSSSSAYGGPALMDQSPDAPSIPPLLFNTAALPEIVAELRTADIAMERRNDQSSDVDCHPTMSVKNDGFAGDVIASSTLLVYEDPVVTEESPDASVVNTVTHSELVFEQWIDELAMEPRDEHDTNVDVKLTSSDGNDDFIGDVIMSSSSSSLSSAASLSTMLSNLD